MKLATLKAGGRNGTLVVVNKDLTQSVTVPHIALSLQAALDEWSKLAPELEKIYKELNAGKVKQAKALNFTDLHSPLPRAYQWVDGSAYLNHVELVRKARGAEMPPNFYHDPLMYQGCSDAFLAPTDPILAASENYGIDFESEVAIITDDVPMGISAEKSLAHIKLIMLVNDVSLRNLIPEELAKGFGFLQSKPASAFSPIAITPDELGTAWKDGKVHLPLRTMLNGKLFGEPNAGVDMNFNFPQLVSHAAKTRQLCAGSIVGSGTISNKDRSVGSSCLAERRVIETIEKGKAETPFLKYGDTVTVEMLDAEGQSIFGKISQNIAPYTLQVR